MASKSKRRAQQQARKKDSATPAVLLAMLFATFAILQNRYGQFSDIRGFYGMHFADGLHHWPFSTHTLTGATDPIHPVEYPALTGLVMWLISFFIAPSQLAWVSYFQLTATIHVFLFGGAAYAIKKLSSSKYAMVFAVTPAVLYSLNRNWDIWAVLPMLIAIIYYEKGKHRTSAIYLAISIATKFFPLVLFFPLAIAAVRNKEFGKFLKYLGTTLAAWVAINLPFALINFEGWWYFYKFNFERGLGSASVWDITGTLHIPFPNNNIAYYILNIGTFVLLGAYLYRSKKVVPLTESAYFATFAFILFNKQYSMQYIIWLAALAVIAISKLDIKRQMTALYFYIAWQVTDLAFQYTFFQQILTNATANTATPSSPVVTTHTYAVVGLIRYIVAIAFTVFLAWQLANAKKDESEVKKS